MDSLITAMRQGYQIFDQFGGAFVLNKDEVLSLMIHDQLEGQICFIIVIIMLDLIYWKHYPHYSHKLSDLVAMVTKNKLFSCL